MRLNEILRTENKDDKKKVPKVIIWMIAAAIIFLVFGNFSSDKKESSDVTEKNISYAREQEEKLEKILKKINGAGVVSVYIKLDDEGEAVTAKDEKKMTEEEADNSKEEFESKTVIDDKAPYIVKRKTPQISGVLVVAEGAANEAVRVKIYEAVKALYGMAPHRIKVTY